MNILPKHRRSRRTGPVCTPVKFVTSFPLSWRGFRLPSQVLDLTFLTFPFLRKHFSRRAARLLTLNSLRSPLRYSQPRRASSSIRNFRSRPLKKTRHFQYFVKFPVEITFPLAPKTDPHGVVKEQNVEKETHHTVQKNCGARCLAAQRFSIAVLSQARAKDHFFSTERVVRPQDSAISRTVRPAK